MEERSSLSQNTIILSICNWQLGSCQLIQAFVLGLGVDVYSDSISVSSDLTTLFQIAALHTSLGLMFPLATH